MTLNPSNSSNMEQLALKGLTTVSKFQLNVDVHTAMYDIVLLVVFNWSEIILQTTFLFLWWTFLTSTVWSMFAECSYRVYPVSHSCTSATALGGGRCLPLQWDTVPNRPLLCERIDVHGDNSMYVLYIDAAIHYPVGFCVCSIRLHWHGRLRPPATKQRRPL